jgi:hypothetical protein
MSFKTASQLDFIHLSQFESNGSAMNSRVLFNRKDGQTLLAARL